MNEHILPVPLEKAYRLLTHGPTVLVSGSHEGVDNVMAAAWACALDFAPPKLTVVLDKSTRTRALVEGSGSFVIQLPTVAQLRLTHEVGNRSLDAEPDKLARAGVVLKRMKGWRRRWWKAARPGWPAGCCRNRTTSRPTTCSSAR